MKKPCDIIREFLNQERDLLNMKTVEKLADLPKTKLSQVMNEKRELPTAEVFQILEVFEDFTKRVEKLRKELKASDLTKPAT